MCCSLGKGKERAGAFAVGFPHLPPISLELIKYKKTGRTQERESIASGHEMTELTFSYVFFEFAWSFLRWLWLWLFFVETQKSLGGLQRKAMKTQMDVPVCSSLHSGEILQAGRRSQLGSSPAMWLCWEEPRLGIELSWRGQRNLGEAGEQPWLC